MATNTKNETRLRMNEGERRFIVDGLIAALPENVRPYGEYLREYKNSADGYRHRDETPQPFHGWYGAHSDEEKAANDYRSHLPALGLIWRIAHAGTHTGRLEAWIQDRRAKFADLGNQGSF